MSLQTAAREKPARVKSPVWEQIGLAAAPVRERFEIEKLFEIEKVGEREMVKKPGKYETYVAGGQVAALTLRHPD